MWLLYAGLILVSIVFISVITSGYVFAQPSQGSLKILSFNSFVNTLGLFHVVGEIQNDSPSVIPFVQVIGTFYDADNKVVGTSLTYTTPSDVLPGAKAPFDLILYSASVPVQQISNYTIQTSHQ